MLEKILNSNLWLFILSIGRLLKWWNMWKSEKNKCKKIFILTPNPFPIGNVATNRISTYAKSLARHGFEVHVLILKGTDLASSKVKNNERGVYQGVSYRYMATSSSWDTKWSMSKKLLLYSSGLIRALRKILMDRPDAVLIYTNDILYMTAFFCAVKIVSSGYFIDKSEYPVVHYHERGLGKWLYIMAFKLFDGIIVMTHELSKYYSSIKSGRAKIFHLPMSVDLERFSLPTKYDNAERYFCCVFGVHNRDCIADTIRSFDVFSRRLQGNKIKLKLIGDYTNLIGREDVDRVVRGCEYKENIDFVGVVNGADMPIILLSAMCLVTTPVEYKSGGFPTKLGEYLATGRPVIVTEVGEIPKYLKHMESCFFASPKDVNKIAELMCFVACNQADANSVGARGKGVAETVFNVDSYVDDLGDFLVG